LISDSHRTKTASWDL